MAEALDAIVAAHDQACAECAGALERRGHAGLQLDVPLTRPPGAEGVLQRAPGVGGERRETLLLAGC